MINFVNNKNFKVNEQYLYWFKTWLITRDSGSVPWIAKIARGYINMMKNLKEMNE